MSALKKVLITGDSWSAGEWDTSKGDDINFHAREYSLSRYLADTNKYTIIHMPFPGHGDNVPISQIIDRHDIDEIDYIIFVKTCATRNFTYLTKEDNPVWFDEKNILTKITWMNDSAYVGLLPYKDRLIILGGIEKVRSSFKCFLKIPSITEFLYPDFKDNEYFGDIKYINHMVDEDKLSGKFLLDNSKRKIDFWKNHPEMFYPDGVHPNRKAHKKLAHFIDDHIA